MDEESPMVWIPIGKDRTTVKKVRAAVKKDASMVDAPAPPTTPRYILDRCHGLCRDRGPERCPDESLGWFRHQRSANKNCHRRYNGQNDLPHALAP
jgi:hypothetical protein